MINIKAAAGILGSALLIAAAALAGGCAGTHISSEQISEFTVGRDTENEVIAKLGAPTGNFRSVDMDTLDRMQVTKYLDPLDYLHKILTYQFTMTLLLKDTSYTELTFFVFGPDGKLSAVDEYNCYTPEGCKEMIEAEKSRYEAQDLDGMNAALLKVKTKKDKEMQKALEQRRLQAQREYETRLARAQKANVTKKSAGSASAGKIAVKPASATAQKITVKPAPAAGADTGTVKEAAGGTEGSAGKATVRTDIGF